MSVYGGMLVANISGDAILDCRRIAGGDAGWRRSYVVAGNSNGSREGSNLQGSPSIANEDGVREAAIVPLAVPLLAGPAAFSYVMEQCMAYLCHLIHVVAPILIVGVSVLDTLFYGLSGEKQSSIHLDVVQRVGGLSLRRWP